MPLPLSLSGDVCWAATAKGHVPCSREFTEQCRVRANRPSITPSARSATVEVLARPDGQKAHRNERFPSDSLRALPNILV